MYIQKSNMLQAFGTLGPSVVTSTGVLAHRYAVVHQCVAKRLAFLVTTAPTVTDCIINVRLRPTPGSSSGQSSLGTLTVPVGTAIGSYVYKDVAAVELKPGSEIAYDVTQSSTAGGGLPVLVCDEDPETAANVSAMIASA